MILYPEANEAERKEREVKDVLIKGQSVEIGSIGGRLKPKETYYINSMYWEAIKKRPIWMMLKYSTQEDHCVIEQEQVIKLWMGRQLGQIFVYAKHDQHGKKIEISSKEMAILEIKERFGLDDTKAAIYLDMNQAGAFKEEYTHTLKQHWNHRVGIDLSDWENLIKGMKNE